MRLLIFGASHRPASYNRKLAQLAASHARSRGIEVDFAEYGEFDMPLYNDAVAEHGVPDIAQHFAKRMQTADGLILSSPEYNWSYPASVKNIIDWTSRIKPNPVAGKTALLLSATPGSRGGIVGLNHLKTPLEALQLFLYPKVFPLGNVEIALDHQGFAREPQRTLFISLLDGYFEFTRRLSTAN